MVDRSGRTVVRLVVSVPRAGTVRRGRTVVRPVVSVPRAGTVPPGRTVVRPVVAVPRVTARRGRTVVRPVVTVPRVIARRGRTVVRPVGTVPRATARRGRTVGPLVVADRSAGRGDPPRVATARSGRTVDRPAAADRTSVRARGGDRPGRDQRDGGRRDSADTRRAVGPAIPEWADPQQLDAPVRRALRGLESRNADVVGQHLAAAGGLLDEDPAAALLHAQAARERASRIAVVREAVGVAAYHAGDFTEAARELRAYRRMSGDEAYRAVLADCERALGRPDVALRLVAEALTDGPSAEEVVELRLVEAGARQDLGELPAAALVLEAALGGRPVPEQLSPGDLGQLRLATAYADLLVARGEDELAHAWFEAVMAADPDDETGVAARFDDVEYDDERRRATRTRPRRGEPRRGGGRGRGRARRRSSRRRRGAGGRPRGHGGGPPGRRGRGRRLSAEEAGLGTDYDPDEQDVEAEVAELLGEIPAPGFSDGQPAGPVTQVQPRPLPADQSGLFAAPGEVPEHDRPTD